LDKLSKEASTLEKEVESAAAAMDVVRLREICDRLDEIVKECTVALADAMSTIEQRAEAAKLGNA
jgi:tRNA C32,U32 (ribose-2'-O)-methylase TrmJ